MDGSHAWVLRYRSNDRHWSVDRPRAVIMCVMSPEPAAGARLVGVVGEVREGGWPIFRVGANSSLTPTHGISHGIFHYIVIGTVPSAGTVHASRGGMSEFEIGSVCFRTASAPARPPSSPSFTKAFHIRWGNHGFAGALRPFSRRETGLEDVDARASRRARLARRDLCLGRSWRTVSGVCIANIFLMAGGQLVRVCPLHIPPPWSPWSP